MRRTSTITTRFERHRYGFILADSCRNEIFFNASDLPDRKALSLDSRAYFELGQFGGRIKTTRVFPEVCQ